MEVFNKSLMYTIEKKANAIERIVQVLFRRFILLIVHLFFVPGAKNN